MAYIPLYTKQIFTLNFIDFIAWKNLKAKMGCLFSKRPLGLPCTVSSPLTQIHLQTCNESIGSMLPKDAPKLIITLFAIQFAKILKLNVIDVMVKEKQNLFTQQITQSLISSRSSYIRRIMRTIFDIYHCISSALYIYDAQ